ncbi:MAG TPA: hypothetical protein VOA87_21750 [Thermoanaerobaculia bacterium]|nr:hypothetical protein [Thermoanaerobaculia bacterium]
MATLGAIAVLPLLTAACGKVKSPTEPPASAGPAFTFARIQAEIFTPNCAKSGCHSGATAQQGMVLEAGVSYGQIVGRRSQENPSLNRVQPGSPEQSYLLKKVRGDGDITGSRMPQDGPPFLSQAQIDGIAGWIQAGAPNN